MRVLFINPPAKNEILSCNPEIIKEERGFDPPLGLLYLAGYLKKHTSHELKIIDAQVEKLSYSDLQKKIKDFYPDVICLTALTFTLLDILETIKVAKEVCPQTIVILGGPHPHLYPKETINLKDVDYLVLGEGEETLFELLNHLNDKNILKQIPGLVFKDNQEIINTGPKNYLKNLDELPFPPREMLPYKKYFSLLAKDSPITTMFTSRGCPFKCAFCDRPNMGKNFRARSAKNVVAEIKECLNLGIKEIFIYDDTFTVNKPRVVEICQEILKQNLKFHWDIRTRVDTVDEEMLKLLKKAGCVRIHYGVESGTEKILKILNKNISLDRALKTFKVTKKLGIDTLAYFMLGAPEETQKDILKTIDFAKKLKPDFVQFTLLTPFPGTEIYAQALAEKIFPHDYWQEFAQNPQSSFKTKYWTRELSLKELQELLTLAYKKFYLRPGYIAKRLLKIKSLPELMRKIKAGFSILKMKKDHAI